MKRILTIVILAVAAFAAGVIAQGNEPEPTFTIPIYEEHPKMWTDYAFFFEQAAARNAFLVNNQEQHITCWLFRNNYWEGKEFEYTAKYMGSSEVTAKEARHHINNAIQSAKCTKVTSTVQTRRGMATEAGHAQYAARQKMYEHLLQTGGYEVLLDAEIAGFVHAHIVFAGENPLLEGEPVPGNKPKKTPAAKKPGNVQPLRDDETVRVKGRIVRAVSSGGTTLRIYAIGESIERVNP